MHVLCEQNPLIYSEIPESDVVLACCSMGLGKGNVEGHSRKLYGSELWVLRRRCDESQIKLTHQHPIIGRYPTISMSSSDILTFGVGI
jgi:hypothetical protein